MKKWIARLIDTVSEHWHWNGQCHHFYTAVKPPTKPEEAWEIAIAPALQELEQGPRDGQEVWTPFAFDIGEFIASPGVQQCNMGVRSRFCCEPPMLFLDLLYKNRPVNLLLYMEPPAGAEPMEVVNTVTKEIRHKCRHPHHDES